MTLLYWAVVSPFIFAIVIPIFYRYIRKIHTGWFVLFFPLILFIYFINYFTVTSSRHENQPSMPWMPSLTINCDLYLDGLSLLFALLITGIGALVILYSIFYLSKTKENLNNFYVYLLLFMGAMLGVVLSENIIRHL